ncbi:MAG: winged helix-turn-helix domain-containing protein, partial [Terricaulis sp.]
RRVTLAGEEVHLTPIEYRVLSVLARHAGKVMTHRQLLQSAWPDDASADVQALRVHVRHLRQKVELNPDAPVRIATEPGVGYRFTPPE